MIAAVAKAVCNELLMVTIGDQAFGLPVDSICGVLNSQPFTRVALAPSSVMGILNLRGRIATIIDLRQRLGLPPRDDDEPGIYVVVEQQGELYSLLVDTVGTVIACTPDLAEPNPSTLPSRWRQIATDVYRLDTCLLIVLNITALLNLVEER